MRLVLLARAILILSLCGIGVSWSEQTPPPEAHAMPSWAQAMLVIREQGASFERLSAWCDKVATNTGSVAQQTIVSALFSIPVQEGTAPKGSAILFLLDTAEKGPLLEALVLALSDAKVFTTALQTALGAVEKDGLLHVKIPQGFEQPEKLLVIQIEQQMAWVAPDAAWLAKIRAATLHGARDDASPEAPDLTLKVNLAVLRERYQRELVGFMGALEALGTSYFPQAADALAQAQGTFLRQTRDLKSMELRLRFSGDNLDFAADLLAQPGTAWAALWDRQPATRRAELAAVLPGVAALNFEAWPHPVKEGTPVVVPKETPRVPEVAPTGHWIEPAMELWKSADEGALCTLVSGQDGSVQLVLLLAAQTPAQTEAAVQEALKGIVGLVSNYARTQMQLKPEEPAPYELEALPETAVKGTQVKGHRVVLAKKYRIFPEIEQAYARAAEWPVCVRYAAIKQGVLVAVGKNGAAALQYAIEQAAQVAQSKPLAAETGLTLTVQPMALARAYLNVILNPTLFEAAQFTDKLEDVPIRIQGGAQRGTASVRAVLPAQALRGLFEVYLKLDRAGIDPFSFQLPGGSVPAPAPPQAP